MGSIKQLRSAVWVLIVVNLLTFLCLRLLATFFGEEWVTTFAVPAGWGMLLHRPWTVLTYMFAQIDLWQLLFNMLWLWWTGKMLTSLRGERSVAISYIVGGIAGAVAFILYNSVAPGMGSLIGSSCSVLSVMVCAAVIAPNLPVNLLFFGYIKLKWVVVVSLLLYAIGSNFAAPAACVAHLAGVAAGLLIGVALRKPAVRKRTPRPKLSLEQDDELILNGLLDKVRQSGYTSLTPSERILLIEITKRIGK